MYIVALVDSGASHSLVAAKLVKKYQLTVNLGSSIVVTLADSSQVTTSETCSVPIIYMYYEQQTCVLCDLVLHFTSVVA